MWFLASSPSICFYCIYRFILNRFRWKCSISWNRKLNHLWLTKFMFHVLWGKNSKILNNENLVERFILYLMARYIEISNFRQYEVSRKLELNIHTFIVSKYFYDCIFSFPVGYQNNSFTTRFRVPKCSPQVIANPNFKE